MKDQYEYFLDNVWPDVAAERGLPDDAEPTDADFTDWYSGMCDTAYDSMRDGD